MKYQLLTLLTIFFFPFSSMLGQETTREKDFTVHYLSNKLELEFDKLKVPSNVKVIDILSNSIVPLEKKSSNVYNISQITPSELFRVEYTLNDSKSETLNVTNIASKSASSGTMTVYFNHPVDITYSQTQNAVNLSNTLDDMLITYINNCVSTLDIAVYSSYSPSATTGIAGAINAAYNRGVQVRVIYDGSTTSAMIPLLNSAIPRLASPTTSAYGIMHNKFVIFDANNSNPNVPYVWTGSTNWTTAQIDGPDKNSVIIIQDQSLALAYKIEFEEMWGSSTATPNTTLSKFGPYKTDNTPHNFIIGGKTVESYFSPSDGTTSRIISAVDSANSDIEIAVMNFTRTDISNAVISKYNSGLTNTNVLLDSSNPSGNQIGTLQTSLGTNRALVYSGAGIMHHKFMVIDNYNSTSDPLVLLGSHNWSTSAETKNDENTLIVHDANIANQYYQAFAYLFQLAGGVIFNPLSTITSSSSNDKDILKIYPNPNNGIINITSQNTISTLEVNLYDILGEKINSKSYTSFDGTTLDISNNSSGIYIVEILADGKPFHYKIIKK